VAVGPDGVWVAADRSAPPTATSNVIKIGIYADCSGFFGGYYDASLAAAELPLIQRGARRAGPDVTDGITGLSFGGRPVKLYFGCDDIGGSMNHGTIREVRRLVEKVGVDILIGPTEGEDMIALQPYMRRHPETTFVNGSGAEPLRNPAPNFFNFYTDATQWNAGLGAYAYNHLGWRHAVIIDDSHSARFTVAQSAAFVAEFCSLGGTIAKRIWIPFDATDLSATVGAVPRSGVDGFFLSTYGTEVQALAGGYPALRGKNVSHRIVLSSANRYVVPGLVKMWRRATGLVYSAAGGGPGIAPGSKYLTGFKKAFPNIPASLYGGGVFDLGYYNGAAAAVEALVRVHGDLSGGQRRFRAALSRVSIAGPSGRVMLDAHRQAVAPTYLYRLEGPKLTPHLIRTIPRVEPTFGGYFKATDPPPSRTTPACIKRTPPPWARSGS
jgi:branched-chain amino acid transport system substrate-binding protein